MNVFTDAKDYFNVESTNPWKGTPLADYYALNPAKKGNEAERIVSSILISLGHKVESRLNAGHDRIVDGVKTEIKFALATEKNSNYGCIFNHIGMNKDWNNILFVCVNGDGTLKGTLFTRDSYPAEFNKAQQGGKNGGNDDFMISATESKDLLFHKNGISLF